MTPEQAVRFILRGFQNPELKAIADRECDEMLAEYLKDPANKAAWAAQIRAFADEIDRRIVEDALKELGGGNERLHIRAESGSRR